MICSSRREEKETKQIKNFHLLLDFFNMYGERSIDQI